MAIDTRDKRSSAINHGSPWRGMWPAPDGSLAALADRQHIAWLYRGLADAAAIYGWLDYTASGRAHYTASGITNYSARGKGHYSAAASEPFHYSAKGRIHYTAPEDDA